MSQDNLNNPFSVQARTNEGFEQSEAPYPPQSEQSQAEAEEYAMFVKLMQKFGGAVSNSGLAPNQNVQQQVYEETQPNQQQAYAQQQAAIRQYQQQAQVAQAAQNMVGAVPQNFQQFRQAQASIPQRNMGNIGAFNVQPNESLIIQNALGGPLFIADLNLTLAPGEPWDLGYNQEARYSRDLSKCFQYGFIKVLTEEEYMMALQHETYQNMVEDQEREMRMIQRNDMDLVLEAEHIDLTGDQGSGRQEFQRAVPNMNNPFLRGAQYMQAQAQNNQQIDPALYHQQMTQQATSRQGKKMSVADVYNPFSSSGQATVMQAPTQGGRGAQAQNVPLSNFNTGARANVPAQINPGQPMNQQFQSVNPFLQQQQKMGYQRGEIASPVDLANDRYNDDAFGDFNSFDNFDDGPSGITRIT